MESLKAAMQWDIDTYGLYYDLNWFNIVAVPNFNFGAMENKSLNIFNSALLLCSPETSTDNDFVTVRSVVGHEYFHNWTGNRVTCRYADSCVKRISELLRTSSFFLHLVVRHTSYADVLLSQGLVSVNFEGRFNSVSRTRISR